MHDGTVERYLDVIGVYHQSARHEAHQAVVLRGVAPGRPPEPSLRLHHTHTSYTGSRTAWVVSIVPWGERTLWVV